MKIRIRKSEKTKSLSCDLDNLRLDNHKRTW